MKRIQAIIVGLLLLILVLPQSAVAAGPGISDVSAEDITATTATITWATNGSCIGTVYYDTSNSTPLSNHESESVAVTDHVVYLEGLEPDTLHYYYVVCGGERFPADEDEYRSFVTLESPEGYYKITLDDACYVCGEYDVVNRRCGEVIGVTAVVAVAGTYHICWDSRSSGAVEATFETGEPGTRTLTFHVPETIGGLHTVYLTNTAFNDLGEDAEAQFTINPSVTLFSDSPLENDNEGPVGTKVTLYGHGFNSNEQIRIEFNDTVVSSDTAPKANTKGSWEFSYTIADTPGGSHTFDVGPQANPDVVLLSKYFKVTPEITAPSSGTVGQTLEVKGTGFQSEESNIEITFRSKSTGVKVVVMEGIHANADGSWTEEIVVPTTLQRGTYFIDASGESTRARYITDIEVTLVPGIFLDRASAPVGDPITVTGGGFTREETGIKVKFDEDVVASGITANEDGTWTASFDVPVSVFGPHTVSASGDKTPAVENTLDTKAQITSFSPDEGAPGDLVRITGNGFHDSQTLTVAIGSATSTETLQTQSNGNVNIDFHVPRGSVEGEGILVVTDQGGANAEIQFTVTTKTLSTVPIPVSPKDSTLRSGDVTFEWQGLADTTGYMYILEVSRNADFSTTVFPYKEVSGSSYELTGTETLQERGTYYWRVKIMDDYGNEGEWSEYAEFRVSPIQTWVWVVIGIVVLVVLMVVAYRETKFRVSE